MTRQSVLLPPASATVPRPFNAWEELASFSVLLMEASWLAPVFRALSPSTAVVANLKVLAFFLGISWITYLVINLLYRFQILRGIQRGALAIIYGASFLAGSRWLLQPAAGLGTSGTLPRLLGVSDFLALIPGQVLVGVLLLWVVWRATQLARQTIGNLTVLAHFKLGVVVFLLYSGMVRTDTPTLPGLGFYILFLSATLLALATARVSILGKFRGGRQYPFDRRWLGGIAAAVAATLGAALSTALLATGRLLEFYQRVLYLLIVAFLGLVAAPFIFILSIFPNLLEIKPLPAPEATPVVPPWELPDNPAFNFAQSVADEVVVSQAFWNVVTWIAIGVFALVVIGFIWRVNLVYQRRIETGPAETTTSAGNWLEKMRQDAKKKAQEIANRVLGLERLRQRQRFQAAAQVRRIYAALMDLSADLGFPRPASQTPLEFLPTLREKFPAHQTELIAITQAYLKIRYGELPETRAEVQVVEQAWQTLRHAGEKLKKTLEAEKKQEETFP